MLSLVSAVYDRIGLVAPYTVQARVLLKDIWRLSGQQWDDDLLDEILTKFIEWSKEFPTLGKIEIPRSYFEGSVKSLELHMFGDSSKEVFSAVAFLRGKVTNGNCTSTKLVFVFGKVQVAPMKALAIPKLELQASLLAARLRRDIQNALTMKVDRISMWTDSTTVLQWLHSLEKQPVFVTNRVAEILNLSTVDEWNYVTSSDNTANVGTRGLCAKSLRDSPWLTGPSFLKTSDWPSESPANVRFQLKAKTPDLCETDHITFETETALSVTVANIA